MQSNPFNNLPKINKKDAINILKKPIAEINLSADYYKAVFHLANFPCEESETVLLEFIKSDSEQLAFKIAKRKAIVCRNQRTGESIQIAASQKVKFLPAKSLKEMFNR